MSKIEAEILEATGVNPKKGESRADFLDRLTNYLDDNKKFTDADYNKLSDPAQKWANAACTALGKREPIPEFPDAEKAKDDKGGNADEGDKGSSKPASAEDEKEDVGSTKKKKAAAAGNGKGDKKTGVAKTGDVKKTDKAEKKAAAPKAEKKAKPAKEPKEKKAGGKSADLKKLILAKPTRTNAELMDLMEKKGHDITLSTLSTIRSGFLHSMQVIIDEGRLKPAKD